MAINRLLPEEAVSDVPIAAAGVGGIERREDARQPNALSRGEIRQGLLSAQLTLQGVQTTKRVGETPADRQDRGKRPREILSLEQSL